MKKNLLTFLLITTFSAFGFAQVCTPDPNATGLFYPAQPDSTANPGEWYEQTMTLSVPTDTNIVVATIHIDSVFLDSVRGLPVGLTYGCNSSLGNCNYPGGTDGCFIISGTLNANDTVGVYPITFDVILYGVLDSTPTTLPYSLDLYSIYVGNVGVQTLNLSKFDVIQNIPNPFNGNTTIKFSSPANEKVDFLVYDMIGKQVYNSKINAVTGINKINFSSEKLAPGAYFYTLANSKTRITKRMIVTGK